VQAIILAAGLGRRMRPISDDLHKSLVAVAGTTILGRTLDALSARGVRDITIVTGYRAADIRAFVAARGIPVEFVHNDRFLVTNNIVSLALALDAVTLDTDVVLVECDLLFDPAVLDPLFDGRPGNIALVDRWRPGMDGTVVSVDDGVITHVWPPHLQGETFDFADKYKTLNVYRFDRDFCRDIFRPLLSSYANFVDGDAFYELVLGMLVNMKRHTIRAEVVDGTRWAEVDDPNDLAAARFTFDPTARKPLLDNAFGGLWNYDVLDFAFMRNAHFPTASMMATMRQALPDLVRSYGSAQPVLNEKLAWFAGCSPQRVQVLHGASQIFPLLEQTGGPGLIPHPTFGEWNRAFPHAATYADAPGIDLQTITGGGPVVFVNPNSPTGTTVPTSFVHDFAARNPGLTVIVDESFIDFSDEEPVQSLLEREPLRNVVVVRSLSKSLGVPGLRLGYVYSCDESLVNGIGSRLPVWNLSSPAEFFLELLLKYRRELDESFRRTIADRADFAADLKDVVGTVYEGGGNFLLVHMDRDDGVADRLLAEHRIYVKDVSDRFGGGTWLRIGVRLPDENALLVRALQ